MVQINNIDKRANENKAVKLYYTVTDSTLESVFFLSKN
jgi:hypothetical protein